MQKNQYFTIAFVAVLSIATYLFATTVLYRNWDVLPYMAMILKVEGDRSMEEIHHTTFEEAAKHIPEKQYKKLIDPKDTYRKTIYDNPAHLEEQLPFYAIKPLYVFATYLSYKLGFHLAYATTFPSAVAYVLIALLLFHWFSRILPQKYAFAVCLVLIFIPPLNKLSRYASPDGLSNLFLMIGLYLFLARKSSIWLVNLILAFAILTRSDNVIFALILNGLVYISGWLSKKPKHLQFFGSAIVLTACYLIPQLLFKPPGWPVLFYHTFIQPSGTPMSAPMQLTSQAYWSVLTTELPKVVGNLFFYSLLTVCFVFIPKIIKGLWSNLTATHLVMLAIIGTVIVKLPLFPVFWDRMYLAFNLVIILLTVKELYPTLIKKSKLTTS